jgi:hypothetical protein
MGPFTKSVFVPSTAIIYITLGALMDIWTAVYYFVYRNEVPPQDARSQLFWVAGFFFTGLVLIVIGFAMGPIGRAARQAELPPAEPAVPVEATVPASAVPNEVVINDRPNGQFPANVGYSR